jgi:anaerobic selenocysteine-containing dehydrogenase
MKGRRKFLQASFGAGVAAAAVTTLSKSAKAFSALSYSRISGANRRVRVGLIGCGGRGSGVMRSSLALGTELIA